MAVVKVPLGGGKTVNVTTNTKKPSDAVQAAVKAATQAGTTNAAQASNAQAKKIYESSAPFLTPKYFTGVGSTTVYTSGTGGTGKTGITGGTGGTGGTAGGTIGGGTIENQPPPPAPKPPTAGELGVVKTPGRDVTRISDLVQQTPADTIKRLAFEQLSAIELSQILTSNTVDGIDQKYSIISNLSDIRKRYDASTNLSIMNKNTPMTGVYNIDIDSKIPGFTYLLQNNLFSSNYYVDIDNSLNSVEKGYIYIDTNGDLIIEVDNMKSDEILQVQIVTDGTIYEVTN